MMIRNVRSSILQSYVNYREGYKHLAKMDKKFAKVNSKEQKEAIDSELALIDGFMTVLDNLYKQMK